MLKKRVLYALYLNSLIFIFFGHIASYTKS